METISGVFCDIANYGPKIPTALVIIFAGWVVIRLLNQTMRRAMRLAGIEPTLVSFVTACVAFAVWVFVVSIVFSALGFPQISIAFSGSIALLVVGIASKADSMIQDLFAGIFLIADPHFMVGKFVRVSSVIGEVVSLDIKKTKIKDREGNLHVVSNKVFDLNTFVIEDRDKPPT